MGKEIGGFDWDTFNIQKCQKHGVSLVEIEFILDNEPRTYFDYLHSEGEDRYLATGTNQIDRHILVVFTYRNIKDQLLVRPLSARYMHQREINKFKQYD